MGLGTVAGSLVPGKQADLISIATTRLNFMPPAEPVASSVLQARASDVSELMIAGKLRKQDGKLFDVDLDSLRKRIGASQKHLIEFARSAIAVVRFGGASPSSADADCCQSSLRAYAVPVAGRVRSPHGWICRAPIPARTPELGTAQGHVGHRTVPQRGAGWTCVALISNWR